MPPRHLHPHENFWPKVDRRGPDECWPWTSSRNHKGYGHIARRRDGRFRYIKATHIAWEIANGQPFPAGKIAMHSCDNPGCVNPAHIKPGTHAENIADRDRKGRGQYPSPAARCCHGHDYTPENTAVGRNGKRTCRECTNARQRRVYHQKRTTPATQ